MGLVDLHLHSRASDGEYPPAEVMRLCREAGREAAALTDHDTMEGVAEAEAAARELGLRFVYGVELSVSYQKKDIHLLGYFNHFHPGDSFNLYLKDRLAMRQRRLDKMVTKLAALGLRVEAAEILEEAGESPVGRPHVARVLFKRGYVSSVQEAFDRYLRDRGPAYVRYEKLEIEDGVKLVKEAGGLAVLAHPGIYNLASADLAPMVRNGLDGIECYHSEHTLAQAKGYAQMAEKLGVCVTGGSDFHGNSVHCGFNEPAAQFPRERAEGFFRALEGLG